MNEPLPMTAADWSWLFQARPQAPQEAPAAAPMQLASAAPAAVPTPPTRPRMAAQPPAAVPLPPRRPADIGPYGAMPPPAAFTNLAANPASGADAEALLRSRQPYGALQRPAVPPPSADAQPMADALMKRGQISPDILTRILSML